MQTLRPEIVCRQVTIVPRAHPALVPRERLYRVLLRLWRLAPLPQAARGFILWCANQRFLIGVVGLIWDDQGRLLLARHSYLPPPGWSLPGGWLGADESLEAGVARELAEELGMAVEVGPLVGWARQRTPRHFTFGFACRPRGGDFQPSGEILEIRYFPPDAALRVVPGELRPLVRMALAHRAAPRVLDSNRATVLESPIATQPTTEYLPLSREVEGDGPMKPGNPSPMV